MDKRKERPVTIIHSCNDQDTDFTFYGKCGYVVLLTRYRGQK